MCFKLNNENFIRIKLYSEMKGLSESDKLEKYLTLKDEVYKRLNKSYSNCNSKIEFYKDTLEVLGFYEGEYLMLNLFLEQNCIEIIDSLLSNDFFNQEKINISNTNSLSYLFYSFIISKSNFTDDFLVEFLKNKSIEVTQTITNLDWKNENNNNNPLVNRFVDLFTQTNQVDDYKIIGYYILTKIWNYFDVFINPFNNTKGIILFNKLNNYLKNNENGNFFTFYKKINKISNSLLTKPSYLPIIDSLEMDSYKEGYLKNRRDFWDYMKLQKQRAIVSSKMNYSELLEIMDKYADNILVEKCEQEVKNKINAFQYPQDQELSKIKRINIKEKNILGKFYLY